MDTIKNVTQLLIGKDVAETTKTDLAFIASGSDFNNGEIFIADQINRYLDGTTAAVNGLIKYGQARGSEILWSDVIDLKNNLRNYSITSSASESQQLDYIGSNGTAGDITGVASNIYTVRLNIFDKTTAGFMQQKIKEGFYKSNSLAASFTQWAIAEGLVNSLIANYSRETEQDLTFGVINSGANLVLATGAGTVTFTKGSKYAVFGTAIDDPTGTILGVGDLLAVSSAKTEHMYRVVAIDVPTETATLDHAFQGATATVANATVGRVLAATAQAADYGVKIQGVNREFKAGYFPSNVMFWETQIDFASAAPAVVGSTAAFPGVGTGDYIAHLEKELQADEHIYRSHVESGVVDRADAQVGNTNVYDVQIIEHDHTLSAAQGTPTLSPKTLEIAWKTGTNANAVAVLAIQELLFTAASVTYVTQPNLT